MALSRFARHDRVRYAGVVLTVLSLAHLPLPWPDYHVIQHEHSPGQVCAHHDHLLRWHPEAGDGVGVMVLHWHWTLAKSVLEGERADESRGAVRPLPCDPFILLIEEGLARSQADPSRWLDRVNAGTFCLKDYASSIPGPCRGSPRVGHTYLSSRHTSALLQRWTC